MRADESDGSTWAWSIGFVFAETRQTVDGCLVLFYVGGQELVLVFCTPITTYLKYIVGKYAPLSC